MLPILFEVYEDSQIKEEHEEEREGSSGHQPEPEGVCLDVGLVLPQLGVDEGHEVPVLVRLGLDLEEPGYVYSG